MRNWKVFKEYVMPRYHDSWRIWYSVLGERLIKRRSRQNVNERQIVGTEEEGGLEWDDDRNSSNEKLASTMR